MARVIHRKPNLSPELNVALDTWEASRAALLREISEALLREIGGNVSMTQSQFYWLQWFAKHGGRGRLEGRAIIMADRSPTDGTQVVTFLHLVAQGMLSGERGELYLTDLGRSHLERTQTEILL